MTRDEVRPFYRRFVDIYYTHSKNPNVHNHVTGTVQGVHHKFIILLVNDEDQEIAIQYKNIKDIRASIR